MIRSELPAQAERGVPKGIIRPMRVVQRLQTASATIERLEGMRVIRWSPCILLAPEATAEIRHVKQQFGLAA